MEKIIEQFIGRTIDKAKYIAEDDELKLTFGDEVLTLCDEGQQCCESRYMTVDEDLKDIVGHKLLKVEVKEGGGNSTSDWDDIHEIAFLEIQTSGAYTIIANHNKHNGSYGGFSLKAYATKVK